VALRHVRLFPPASIWRPFDSRFAQLEQRLLQHRIWIEKEFGGTEEDHATIAKRRSEYTTFLAEQVEELCETQEQAQQRMAKRGILSLNYALVVLGLITV
jgi:hypothetical protein